MDVTQATLLLADFLPQVDNLRNRARENNPTTFEQSQGNPVIVPIEQQSSDFFVFISPEAQVLQQTVNLRDEQQNAFGETVNVETPTPDESVNANTTIGRSQRLGGVSSKDAIAIYRFIDTLR